MSEAASRAGWTRVAFGDVVRHVKDRVDPHACELERYVAGEHMDSDDLRIRRWGTIGDGYLGPAFHMRFKSGHVLYGSRRTYLRKVALADFEGITANTTFVLESSKPGLLLPELLLFIMQTEPFHEHSINQSRGSVNPYINFSDLAWYEFDLPPLEEQRRLVQVLEAAERQASSLRALGESARAVVDSLGARELGLGRESGASNADKPATAWPAVPLEDLVVRDAPVCYGIVQVGANVADGVPTLAINSLGGDYSSGVHRTSPSIEAKYARSRVRAGDVLISVKGTIGQVGIVPHGFTGNISRDLARVRLDASQMRPRFFLHLYRTSAYRAYVWSLVVGSTRAELSIATLRKAEVPCPSLAEQDAAIAILDAADNAVRAIRDRLESARGLSNTLRECLLSEQGVRS